MGLCLTNSVEDEALVKVLYESFMARLVDIMDQSQHSSADTGGEGAAYEFCQKLDAWERQRETRYLALEYERTSC